MMPTIYLCILLAPLLSGLLVGLLGWAIRPRIVEAISILSIALSCFLSFSVLIDLLNGAQSYNATLYTWLAVGGIELNIGLLIDSLSATMMCIVTFISLMVHIYTIGYMKGDLGYRRFFSYISLFTFAMLTLVMSNNCIQLFFGWEAVGLVSYLLIGFWFKRSSATTAGLKAFLINRVGDIGFFLGIALIFSYCGALDYASIFTTIPALQHVVVTFFPGHPMSLLTVICVLLFIGAMGKSAQFPLHVWLPDSMEGPTPISALIHAATMVTAGIFMVARFSPLFELSDTALNLLLIIGAITALFMGLLGIIQNDIKRVIAYSTLSQLGYMVAGLGASAYCASLFHLMTHAFFKALLFLAAGSVIIGLHHEQDIRYMGGLRRFMPITGWTALIASLSLVGTPFFSGFYSKDAIIEAVHRSALPAAPLAYGALLIGVLITAVYTFRMYFLVFHGDRRGKSDAGLLTTVYDGSNQGVPGAKSTVSIQAHEHVEHGMTQSGSTGNACAAVFDVDCAGAPSSVKESPWVITLPLVLLAIPSFLIGAMTVEPVLFGKFLNQVLTTSASHEGIAGLTRLFQPPYTWLKMGIHAFMSLPFWMALLGFLLSWCCYLKWPFIPNMLRAQMGIPYRFMDKKYYLDDFYIKLLAPLGRWLGMIFWKLGDVLLIDGLLVNGTAKLTQMMCMRIRRIQTGYLYHYAFAMVLGFIVLLSWWLVGVLSILIS